MSAPGQASAGQAVSLSAIDTAKLDMLADWFDMDDTRMGRRNTEVQEDLRAWAKIIREAQAVLAAREPDAGTLAAPWRQGRSQPRNVYARTGGDDWKADQLIGHFDTDALAAEACWAHNGAREPDAAAYYEPDSIDLPSGWREDPEPQPAPGLAPRPGEALAADNARLRDVITEVLAWFGDNGSGRYARVSGTVLARAYAKSPGVAVPEELRRYL